MLAASDGQIYYVLCPESVDVGAKMFAYDPARDKIRALGDLTEACGEAGRKAIPQGKSHVNFVEAIHWDNCSASAMPGSRMLVSLFL